jgi:hypothetical protein
MPPSLSTIASIIVRVGTTTCPAARMRATTIDDDLM